MPLAVLRASGAAFDARAFATAHQLPCDAVWAAGGLNPVGVRHPESGFNIGIAEAERTGDVLAAVQSWLAENRPLLSALATAGGRACIDVALTVGTTRPTRSLRVEPELLSLLAELNVSLEASAYHSVDQGEDAV